MRDDKNVIKITNSKKNICSTKNGSYHLNEFWVFVPVNGQWLGKIGDIFRIWNRKFKKYCKK